MVFVAFNCVLRDQLVQQALAGDELALRKLIAALPRDLPVSIRRAERDRAICDLAIRLRAAMPRSSTRKIARLLTLAGERIEQHRAIGGTGFGELTAIESNWLAIEVSRIIAWAPTRADGSRWPRQRQLFHIIARR